MHHLGASSCVFGALPLRPARIRVVRRDPLRVVLCPTTIARPVLDAGRMVNDQPVMGRAPGARGLDRSHRRFDHDRFFPRRRPCYIEVQHSPPAVRWGPPSGVCRPASIAVRGVAPVGPGGSQNPALTLAQRCALSLSAMLAWSRTRPTPRRPPYCHGASRVPRCAAGLGAELELRIRPPWTRSPQDFSQRRPPVGAGVV
jgi:hypothetical protein